MVERPRQRQLFEPGNEANNERGERGDNVGEQLLLSQPPPRRLLLLLVPDRTGLALFDLPDAQTFELPAPGAPLSPSVTLPGLRTYADEAMAEPDLGKGTNP